MLKRILLLSLIAVFLNLSTTSAATLYTYINGGSSGNWNNANTWTTDPTGLTLVGSTTPANNDVLIILNGYTVSLTANVVTTGHSITINNGGALNLANFTITTINNLSGSGTLRIRAGYFPTVTNNNFLNSFAAGATVEYYDFTGTIPVSINYPNLTFSNSTVTNHIIGFSNASAYSFTIFRNLVTRTTGTGTLTVNFGTQANNIINATINGNITIGANTRWGVGAFNAIHNVTVLGNFTNNGTVDFSNGAQFAASTSGAANLTFTGATNNTLACNGITDLYILTIEKGIGSANILSVTSTNVANLQFYSNGKLLNINQGTLRLGANISIPRAYGNGSANYDLGTAGTSPMLWIDGASFNTNGSPFVAYGKFRITSGSFTCLGGEGTVIREEGQYLIEGGTFTTEKFRPSNTSADHRGSFTMTGGVFNAQGTGSNANYARFSIPYPEQVFIMSGGTINVSNPQASGTATNGGIHIGVKPSNYSVTGGTFNAILSGTATNYDILSTAPFWDLNIQRSGGTPTVARLNGIGSNAGVLSSAVITAQPLVVLNNFTIDGANLPTFNANGLNVTVGKDFTINSGAIYQPSSNTTVFNGTTDQLFVNNGTINPSLFNLTINKASGTISLSGAASTFTISNQLDISGGILNDGGKMLAVAGNIHNESVHTGTGSMVLIGTSTQTISGNGSGIFSNLALNNTSNPGAITTADISVSGTLTLAGTGNSLFDISQYQLAITSASVNAITTTGNAFSSAKMIRTSGLQSDKSIRKTYGNLLAFTFPLGVGSNYTPTTIQLTSAPTSYGTITVRPVSTRHQFVVAGNTNNLTWYWKVVSAGFTGLGANAVNHTYTYNESSVAPANDDATYVPARYNATAWTVINNTALVNETANTISLTGVGYIDGDYTAGRPIAFGTVTIFYSKRSGNWNDTGAGTTPWSNVSHTGPDASTTPNAGDQVFIGDGVSNNHTVIITTNNQSAGGLEINAGSTLDVGTYIGHNFGRLENVPISGSGTLRISSTTSTAEFPAGDFGNFIRVSGGTVEYYTAGSQNFSIPLTSAAPTNLPLITYRNLVLVPATDRQITMPNQNIRVFGNMIVQGQSATALARLNATSITTLLINGNLSVTGGSLQFANGTAQELDIDGNLNIGTGASFTLASTGMAVTNTLTIGGNIVNNGTLDFSNGSYICNVTINSVANTSITGTGGVTDFNILTVSKGSSQAPILNVNASAFSLSGGASPLVLTNGTFRLSSPQTITISNGIDFELPATARLSANGGTIQITGGNGIDLLLSGTLEVISGTVNIGTTENNNALEYAATGSPTINVTGGNLNVRGQIRRSTSSAQGALVYNQSNGNVIVGISNAAAITRGVFEILNPGSSFIMSGGTLAIARASGSTSIADVYLQPTTSNVTGGTLAIGTGNTSQTIDINSTIPVFSVSVIGTSNIARLEANGLTLRGSLSIANSNIFQATSFNVSIAGDFINQNTSSATGVTVGGYQAGAATQTTTLNGSTANQLFTGVTANLTNFGNLIINNTFTSGSVTLSANTAVRVNGTLTLTNGTLADGGNTITAISTVNNSARHTSSTGGSITLAGTGTQFVTGNGTGRFGNLVLNNNSGATLLANQEITGVLTLNNGSLTIGTHLLNLSNPSLAAISGSSPTRYIITAGLLSDGGVTKAFAGSLSSANFTFPVGVGGKYTPSSFTLTTGTTGGNVTLKPVNSKHPSATGSGTAYLNYYWSVNSTIVNLTSITHNYTYVAADEVGNNLDYLDAYFRGGVWTIGIAAGNPDIVSRIITFTNNDLTGDYTAGEAEAFVNPTVYISIASGNWESDLSVWDVDPPGTNIGPPPGSFVIISEGHTVTINTNNKRVATLDINGRLHIGTTTSHDFGVVATGGAGQRTLQLQSSTFPSGNFSSFVAANGGTVEYNGAVTLPPQSTYNNLSFTGAGVKILPNNDLTINGNFTVVQGSVNNSINNRNITLTNSTGDFTNNGTFVTGTGAIVVGRDFTNQGASAAFTAGSGTAGFIVQRNFTNSTNAIFTQGTDSLGIRGSLNNSATFNGGVGAIRVSSNVNVTGGTLTLGSGIVAINGSVVNNSTLSAGTGAITIGGSLTNNSASALFNANANLLTLNGSFTNSTSAVFNAGTSDLRVSGDWTNTANFNAGTGTVTFANTNARALSGTTTFHRLIKTSGGSLTLNNSITVTNTLTLTNGTIVTGANRVNATSIAAQPITGSSTAFIDGRLAISFPNTAGASRVFPVGKGSTYRPVTIQQSLASTLPVIQVEMINTAPSGTFPETLEALSTARYFAVNLLSGTINSPTVELSFNTNAPIDENVVVAGNLRIARATVATGPWTDEEGAGVFSPAAPAGYATSGVTSIEATTFFTIGLENQVNLPISLLGFYASLNNGEVDLKWITASERNNDYFTIERSQDGIRFDSLLYVGGSGTTNHKQTYFAVDRQPLFASSFYRLKQTDFDGTFTYSSVVRINNQASKKPVSIIYPNPAQSSKSYFLRINGAYFDEINVIVTEVSGQVCYTGKISVKDQPEVNLQSVFPSLKRGLYLITISALDYHEVKKLVIVE